MNLEFPAITLALVLPAKSVAGNADVVASPYRHKRKIGNDNATSRRWDGTLRSNSNANRATVDGRKLDLDVGILGRRKMRVDRGRGKVLFPRRRRGARSNDNGLRFLQGNGDDTEESCASQDSCEPTLCECVDTRGNKAADCAEELHALCNGVTGADGMEFTIEGCVAYPVYYREAYCPFVECLVSGETFEKCDCSFYGTACSLYVNDPEYKNDEDVIQNCAADACCKTKTDDEGRATCFETTLSTPGDPTKSPSRQPTSAPTKTGYVAATEPTVPTPAGDSVAETGVDISVTSPSGTASDGSSPDAPADVALAPNVGDVPTTGGQVAGEQTSGGQFSESQTTGEPDIVEQVDDAQVTAAPPTTQGAPVPAPVGDSEPSNTVPSGPATPSSALRMASGMVGPTASLVAAIWIFLIC